MISRIFLAALAAAAMVAGSAATSATVRVDAPQTILFSSSYFSSPGTVIDIDDDGVDDLRLRGSSYWGYRSSGSSLMASGLNGSTVSSGPMLAEGDLIGKSGVFAENVTLLRRSSGSRRSCSLWGCSWRSYTNYSGAWSDGTARDYAGFLGLKLDSGAFGWALLNVNSNGYGQLLAYGYETTPHRDVAAGAPSSPVAVVPLPAAGLMLLGGLGLLAGLRRMGRAA